MSDVKDQRRFSREYKLAVLSRMTAGENVSALSRELGIARKCLYQWRDRFRIGGAIALRSRGRMTKAEAASLRSGQGVVASPASLPSRAPPDELIQARGRIAELERKVGQQELDLDFFQQALRHAEEAQRRTCAPGGMASTRSSKR
jgi:transposase